MDSHSLYNKSVYNGFDEKVFFAFPGSIHYTQPYPTLCDHVKPDSKISIVIKRIETGPTKPDPNNRNATQKPQTPKKSNIQSTRQRSTTKRRRLVRSERATEDAPKQDKTREKMQSGKRHCIQIKNGVFTRNELIDRIANHITKTLKKRRHE